MDPISLVITILVVLALLYLARLAIGELGLTPGMSRIIYICIVLIAILWLLGIAGIYHFPGR